MSKFNSTGRRIMVKPFAKRGFSETGIRTGDDKRPDRGVIVSKGPEVTDENVCEGMVAIFSEYAGKEFNFEGQDYILLDMGELYLTMTLEDYEKPKSNEKKD